MTHDLQELRNEFPALARRIDGNPLTYLDSAATALKPRCVIEAVEGYYRDMPANVHRGAHTLSREATAAYERARDTVRDFLHAAHSEEIVFTSGTTASINLVARSWAAARLQPGDEVLISHMEHHSNIVPWQMLRDDRGIVLRVVPVLDSGELDLDAFRAMLGDRTRLVGITLVSNTLGTVNPMEEIVAAAHGKGALVLVDAAQAVPCIPVDVQALGCDFLAFSGHKLFGPTGIGVLYARNELLAAMPPFLGGGDMILSVSFERTTYNVPPFKFEAGTPNVAGAIGLGRAIEFVRGLGWDWIQAHEQELLRKATAALGKLDGVRLVGTAAKKVATLSFTMEGVHPHDIGTILDSRGVAVRAGHHCTQPLMARFGVPATARASFSVYNTPEDVDRLVAALRNVSEVMR